MLLFRRIRIREDKDSLLEFHCRINFDSETPYMRKLSYQEYRKKWLRTSQPKSFLSDLARTMKEPRTIAEILEDEGRKVGYLWVTFTDIQDYNIVVAAIMDIIVTEDYRRRGVGTMMLKRIEKMAEDRGATLLRSDTGVENKVSKRFHESFGFRVYRLSYEKVLREPS